MKPASCPECGLFAPCSTCGKPRLAVVEYNPTTHEPPVFAPDSGSPVLAALDGDGPLRDAALAAVMQSAMEELDRLRALIKQAEWEGVRGRDSDACCTWCQVYDCDKHLDTCPAFLPDGTVR